MTTKNSPAHVIEAQAKEIARLIKEAERGNPVPPQFKAGWEKAKVRGVLKAAIVMDDKTLIFDLPLTMIAEHTRDELAAWIVQHMTERRETLQ